MNKFEIAIHTLKEIKSSMKIEDIPHVDNMLRDIFILRNKYKYLHEIKTIVLSNEINNLKNQIDSLNTENIILDIGTYKGALKGSYLNRITKLIMRNDPDRPVLLLNDLTSLKAIDIVWDLNKRSNDSYLFYFTLHKVDLHLKFINTTNLIPEESTITPIDILNLQDLHQFATKRTNDSFEDEAPVMRKLGQNVTKLDVLWYWVDYDHPCAVLTARVAKYFPNLTWLDTHNTVDIYADILLKMPNLETLIIMIYSLEDVKDALPSLHKLKFLKLRWKEDDYLCYSLPSIELIKKCKKLEKLYLPYPHIDEYNDECRKYEKKFALERPKIEIVYYQEKPLD